MDKQTPYVNQFCDMIAELESNNVGFEIITKEQAARLQSLCDEAVKQSGLTANELAVISVCRRFKIFYKVSCYAYKLVEKEKSKNEIQHCSD